MAEDRVAATEYPLGYENGYLAPTKYLRFEQVPNPGRKTSVWNVISQSSGEVLGRLAWHGPCRQYVFFPEAATLYNTDCLWHITERLGTLTRWHNNIRTNTKARAA